MKTPIVLYHGSCADGFTAAWAASLALPGAEFVPVNYGEPPPDVRGRDLYLLDFCYPVDVMHGWLGWQGTEDGPARIVLLDHHKTQMQSMTDAGLLWAFREDDPEICLRFDLSKSGARLAWEYFHGGKPAPWLVDYVEDRDLWKWALPDSKAVSAYLASLEWTFAEWTRLSLIMPGHLAWDAILDQGEAILRYQAQQVTSAVKHATEITLGGYRVPCVNATTLTSEIAGKLAEGRPFGVCYFIRADGKVIWSLRSTVDGIDVGALAKTFGGGHPRAAGFESPLLLDLTASVDVAA